MSPNDRTAEIDVAGQLKRHEISQEDHPLSLGKSSAWNQYFQARASPFYGLILDAFCLIMHIVSIKGRIRFQRTEITEQIDRDLQRTHPDMKFFSGDSSSSKKNRVSLPASEISIFIFFPY